MRTSALAVAMVWVVAVVPVPVEAQRFRRPTECSDCIDDWYYFDEDGGGGQQDWSCAASTYDGHRGTDFSLRGGNAAIDTGYGVVAAADGVVVQVFDGFFDRCNACGGSGCGLDFGDGFGNHVVVDHGTVTTLYAHMRTGSVRVAMGDRITCGQVLGEIGSSGCSTGAHLHLETRPMGGSYLTAYDPFQGACSPISPSVFLDQGPHRAMPGATCDPMPPPPRCPAGTSAIWACDADRAARRRCIDGGGESEACPDGCTVMPVGVGDVCATAPVDAGPMPSPDAGLTADASTAGDAATVADPAWAPGRARRLNGGCACAIASPRTTPDPLPPIALALAALGVISRSRRRHRSASPSSGPRRRRHFR